MMRAGGKILFSVLAASLLAASAPVLRAQTIEGSGSISVDTAPPPPPPPPPPAAPTKKVVICVPTPPQENPAPAILEYEEGLPVPPGYRVVRQGRYIWSRGGWAVFGLSYGIAAYVGTLAGLAENPSSDSRKLTNLLIPVAGPFFLMSSSTEGLGNFWLATWGIVQGLGLGAAIYGMATDDLTLRRNDLAKKPRAVEVAPLVAGSRSPGLGLTLQGSF